MSIDVIGTIYEVFPVQSGIGKSGRPWSNQDIVIEIKEGFNSLRYLKMKVPQRLIDTVASIPQGKECEISFIVESRPFEKNGTKTWFTDVVCMDLRTRLSVSDLQYAPPPARVVNNDPQPRATGALFKDVQLRTPSPKPQFDANGETRDEDLPF